MMKEIVNRLKEKFPVTAEIYQRDDLTFVTVEKKYGVDAVAYLKEYEGFTHLVLLTAVDWLEEGEFQLTYLLNNPKAKHDIGLRVRIDRETAEMQTAHHLWPAVTTYEQELNEMFGISFPGSPRQGHRFILDEAWQGPPPYRRDFDTKKYSEETYFPRPGRSKIDPAEHMKKKLYPEGM
ncbi:NADH-quinone oxidoreductase subunit C [Spirochaeta isovalerica]|uniref:NADH-quinone oxidoreductase subunit C n=1 Tax=Spirochaeta isovalerica TaxID=150 RepID=A0A841RG59_9SPIO|nr:NADH-quinone oxidoreductase subunit C [Spirochaeta isovalerica]MBB6481769.1 NADH-quinone oxidoreductase subunit C [Spirochaeta isovalerica]